MPIYPGTDTTRKEARNGAPGGSASFFFHPPIETKRMNYLPLIYALEVGLGLCVLGLLQTRRLAKREALEAPAEAAQTPQQRREDMIYIWTEIHGIARDKAEAMYEEYERQPWRRWG